MIVLRRAWMILPPAYFWPDAGSPRILAMLDRAYLGEGGLLGRETIFEECGLWLCLGDPLNPCAVLGVKIDARGYKVVCGASDGELENLREMGQYLSELFAGVGWYGEVSARHHAWLTTKGAPTVTDHAVIERTLGMIVTFESPRSPRYRRMCHGREVEKVMMGRPRV